MLEALALVFALGVAQVDDDLGESEEPVSLFEYQLAQTSRLDVGGGKTKVSVETNAPTPSAGTFPVRVFIDNTVGPRQAIQLSFRSSVAGGFHSVERTVEVEQGERRTVNVPVPSEMRYGTLTARGPGITQGGEASVYFNGTYAPNKVVLALTRPELFEKFMGKPPRYSGANVQVMTVPPAEAPSELAAYVGYDALIVPDAQTLESLDEGQRRAIEAYAATGGHLIVKGPLRATSIFPLMKDATLPEQDYGFGRLFILQGPPPSEGTLLRRNIVISPEGAVPEYERRYDRYGGGTRFEPLLPQATAPLGRFLLIITAFTLIIGPGSIYVARRRGPAALLVTIPGTALVTCVAIIAYSLISDGFTVHGSTYGFTLLDSKQHRAITTGVTAYYANLAPGSATFSPFAVPVAPFSDRREHTVADMKWKDGLTMGSDFVPSRVYREWGYLSVEPTRARLVVKAKNKEWVVQNALGGELASVVVNIDGNLWSAMKVRDGGEVELHRGNSTHGWTGHAAANRFDRQLPSRVVDDLRPGEFVAQLEGQGFVPGGGIKLSLHSSEQWVRGETEQ